jgi:ATP-binding cassette subfamily B protein
MKTLRAVQGYMLRHWMTLSFGLLLIIVANLIVLIPAYILQEAIDAIAQNASPNVLTIYALQIVGIALVAGVFQFAARFVVNAVSRTVEYEMRRDLFRHFQRMEVAYFQERKIGDLVARATNDLTQVRQMLGPGVTNLVNSLVAFVVTGIAMVTIDAQLTLYSLTVMPLMTVFFISVSGTIHRRFRLVQDQFGEVSARAQENFSGIRVVKAYAQEEAELASFNTVNAEYVRRSLSFARVNSLLWPAMYFISGLAVAVLLWRGGVDVISGRITLGRLVQFNTYLAALVWPMIALGWTVNLVQQGTASLSRITEVREAIPAIASAPGAIPDAVPTRGEVEFRHVSLSYGEREILHDISILVPAGSSLAIVGPTGGGKSSLVNLLARVTDVTNGAALIDGRDVRDIPLADLRRIIGYAPQENFLFSLSIRENVGFGAPELSDEELARALDISQLGADVSDFPEGVETMIGERGVTLSGGQKQRAGIARAVAKDPLILILDDSLSSVDTHTEAAIQARLRDVMRDHTTIVIAHRISTIKNLDQIIVLDDGRITERGSHLELLALGGLYASMYRRQLLAEEMEGDDIEEDETGESDAQDEPLPMGEEE